MRPSVTEKAEPGLNPAGCEGRLRADNPARGSRGKELCWPAASGRALSTGWGAVCGARALAGGGLHKEGSCSITRFQATFPEAPRFLTRHSMTRGDMWPPFQTSLPAPRRFQEDKYMALHRECCGSHQGLCDLLSDGGGAAKHTERIPERPPQWVRGPFPEGWKPGSGRSFLVNWERQREPWIKSPDTALCPDPWS